MVVGRRLLVGHRDGDDPPEPDLSGAIAVVTEPGDPTAAWGTPMPGPIWYWSITAGLGACAAAAIYSGVQMRRRSGLTRRTDPRNLAGTATRVEVSTAAGADAVKRKARHTRPSVRHPHPAEVGYHLGRSHGQAVWASVEDSMLVLGPPRSGKGLHIVIPMLLDAPGAVVTTSTRPDNLVVTFSARQERGPVAVFDPQRLAGGVPGGLRWSPVRGCELPQTAMIRARGLSAGAGMSRSVDGGDFWQGQTESVLRGLLHAAALDGRTALDLYRWSVDPAATSEAVTILGRSGAAPGWDAALEHAAAGDPRTRDSIWLGVRRRRCRPLPIPASSRRSLPRPVRPLTLRSSSPRAAPSTCWAPPPVLARQQRW